MTITTEQAERLAERVDFAVDDPAITATAIRSLAAERDALRAENARLREALKFYGDVSKYPAPLTGGMGALWADCGQIARSALGEKE